MIGDGTLPLKSKGGPINSAYPHLRVTKHGEHIADIWTDIYFGTHSCSMHGVAAHASVPGSHHEIDIAVTLPNASGIPNFDEIMIAVECKNRKYEKYMLRETLGVRRELGVLSLPNPTGFESWPADAVPANPPSCILVYSTDRRVENFSQLPGLNYGIQFRFVPI